MTLDTPRNWKHADQIERDDIPMTSEGAAAARLMSLVGTHLDRRYVTDRLLRDIAGKYVAARGAVRQIFDELDADPKRLPDRGTQLRQQLTAKVDDPDYWAETVHHLRRELSDAEAIWERVKAAHAPDHDVDERGADEDSDRIAQERRDAEAAAGMPQGMTA